MKRQVHMHSRSRVKKYQAEKRKGRHMGTGKRKGTKNARMPEKVLWMRRIRVFRRLLRKYRDNKKLTKEMYHQFYLTAKGNMYKNKNILVEAIHKFKTEKIREKQLVEQQDARRTKNADRKNKRVAKQEQAMGIKAKKAVDLESKPEKSAQKAGKSVKAEKRAAKAPKAQQKE